MKPVHRWRAALLLGLALSSAAASSAEPVKVLRYILPAAETSFDPAVARDLTYTIRLKRGLLFTPDPAFKGRQRELTMADYVYSWKRLIDREITYFYWNMRDPVLGGIRLENERMIFTDILKAEVLCKLQTRNYQWIADYPDGDNFMQLFYGPNIGQNNNGCYQDAQYDAWYAASKRLPAGAGRGALYHKMARRLEATGGAMMGYARYRNMLAQRSVLGYKKHPILHQEWAYIDIERK